MTKQELLEALQDFENDRGCCLGGNRERATGNRGILFPGALV